MDDDEAPPTTLYDLADLSDKQLIVLHVLQICSASLSVMGSSAIVFKILRDRALNRSWTPYDRIILGLSSCDVGSSIFLAIDQFLYPSESGVAWAFGNEATCRAHGFLVYISVPWAWWYNALLSYYFLLTVLSQVRGKNFVRKCEPWMHLSGIFFPITAIMGLALGWYNLDPDLGWLCYIVDPMIYTIVAGIPLLFSYLSVIINNIAIYAILKKSLRSSEHVAGSTPVQQRLKRESTTLMFLYVGSFILCLTPMIVRITLIGFFGYTLDELYPLYILEAIFQPLQGFFNVFIYIRPTYTRVRVIYPNKPRYFVLHQTLFNPKVLQSSDPTGHPYTGGSVNIFDLYFEEEEANEEA